MNVLMTSVDVHKGAEDSMVVRASVGARWFTVYDAVVATAPNYVVIGGGCPQVIHLQFCVVCFLSGDFEEIGFLGWVRRIFDGWRMELSLSFVWIGC